MARITRNSIDIEAVKIQILHEAKLIIGRDGFNQLCMRKLANTVGMTVTNLYSYFFHKDEIYLRVRQAGFDMLQVCFDDAAKSCDDLANLMSGLIKTYVNFGIENQECYVDCVGTELEHIASQEKNLL